MHHIDIHVSDLAKARRLFDPLMRAAGYAIRSEDSDFVSYWRNGRRPSLGVIPDAAIGGSGTMQLAFAMKSREEIDAAASTARGNGASNIDGPAIHEEYGDDYYAVFLEDADGNKIELLCDPAA